MAQQSAAATSQQGNVNPPAGGGGGGGDMCTAYETRFSVIDVKVNEKEKGATLQAGPISAEEQKKQAELLKEASKRAEENVQQLPSSGRRLFLARHGERMDRVFPGWLRLAFSEFGMYRPYDLNMPLSLPPRINGPSDFHDDTPCTEIGYVTAQMIGRGARLTRVSFSHVYCSPALRCVQSAHGMLKAWPGTTTKIRIEPGLFEYMGWYRNGLPPFLTPQEMVAQGYEVEIDYAPIMTIADMKTKAAKETLAEYYDRSSKVITEIINKHPNPPWNILVVGHAPTLDAASRKLIAKPTAVPSEQDMNQMGLHFPYGAVVALEEVEDRSKWQLMHSALPPISYLEFTNRINFRFFNR